MIAWSDKQYVICKGVGRGSTGDVYECVDRKSGRVVAVKTSTGSADRQESLLNELRLMLSLPEEENDKKWCDIVVRGQGAFFGKHAALEIGSQMAAGISYLHRVGIIHTDIKSDNVMFTVDSSARVREALDRGVRAYDDAEAIDICIIDLSDGCRREERCNGLIGSNQYRPPEVTLGLPWTESVDVFALGCVMVEVWTGVTAFPKTDTVAERLAVLTRAVGPLPAYIARKAGPCFAPIFWIRGEDVDVVLTRKNVYDDVVRDPAYAKLCVGFLSLDPLCRLPLTAFEYMRRSKGRTDSSSKERLGGRN
ncbi:kinase-like domain-containing protein [Earliella scabrosa]|nr:kinase-like domain-containing protein [Earliella scabrosa]